MGEATNGSAEDREARRELTAVEKQYFSEWIEPQLEKVITEARRKASFRGVADVYDNFAEEWIEKSMLKVNRLHLHPKFSERVKEYVRGFCEDGAWVRRSLSKTLRQPQRRPKSLSTGCKG